MTDQQLMDIFDFTPEELIINQHGKLSARQMHVLKQAEADETIGLLFGLGILGILIMIGCGLCFALFNVPVLIQSISGLLWLAGAGAVVVIGLVLWVNYQGGRERARQPKVTMTTGVVDFYMDERGIYYVRVDDDSLKLTEDQFVKLQAYHRKQPETIFYRFYHTTHGKQIIAVDAVSGRLNKVNEPE